MALSDFVYLLDKTKSEKSGNRGKKRSEKKESSSSDELEANISESDPSGITLEFAQYVNNELLGRLRFH